MNIHVSYKSGKTPDVEREFQVQIQKLERRLRVFNPDLIHLKAIVDAENAEGASTSINLRLPSGQLAAQKSGAALVPAVKAAFADIVSQLTRHKELLRGDWARKRRQAGRGEVIEPAVPFEQTFASVPAQEQPMAGAPQHANGGGNSELQSWISANIGKLNDFIEQELRFRIANGQIREDHIAPEEVLDEVMVTALSQEDGGTSLLLSSENWFHGLAIQAIRRLMEDNADLAEVSLEAPRRAQNVSGSDENLLQYHQPDDRLQEENLIRDEMARTPEEIVAGEEMVAQLDIVLHEVNAADREAFILFTLEGFTIEEIARLSDRSPEQVRKSIQHARELVQQRLPEQNQYRRRLLQRSRVA
ncbi:MAG TPA: sigma factor-like helix-turn-helix DNA-binding protein [Candidatus Limnocylindrales bacterium]|jgi:RNA polymerase sigma factor (sigma-70 family)|nr:sigma factor-like helix-turn-helix DNA-binding protein [Candidatus Limnocylindrales bacterium]